MTINTYEETETRKDLRSLVDQICQDFPDTYWQQVDKEEAYPEKFVEALTATGALGALIPEEYGGLGLGLGDGSAILEQINYNGANSGAVHAQLYTMNAVLHHGSEEQKQEYLPKVASGDLRLQAFGVTEPGAGTDTTSLTTTAVRDGDEYVVNGQKVFISRVQQSDLMLLLARTTPLDQVQKKSDGISLFLIDIRDLPGLTINPIDTMVNHSTNALFFDDMRIPASSLIGEEGKGFKYVLTGMNAERILIASECIGDGRWFIDRAVDYSKERVVFNRPIGANQGVQFPIARAHVELEAADLMRWKAADLFDAGKPCGAEANMAKMLASEASWKAGDTALQTHGGFGMSREYNIERKFRETRLYQIAPISTNLILSFVGQHVLGMPRSF
ncbi:acyl-CoA dehydrogenase family protein [Brevibacterium jeotgali]|uniref:Acyl-CoA dehydrogenase n=1 Tax=Brevibacterium jeotgali TaxID=1262550 RepID=A0A2H1L2F4_9MICO|nr:acyl-CoA dehydrogenase family protein [Brevibacterium jeotgali]TWC03071.1 acyl-CoA dehydrogenase [Brevibacterium jeotgali]SMY11094.1 acyl-CoA dehydrogenase [Brevibacterium jeotgali]